jgi:hypothetical protein
MFVTSGRAQIAYEVTGPTCRAGHVPHLAGDATTLGGIAGFLDALPARI